MDLEQARQIVEEMLLAYPLRRRGQQLSWDRTPDREQALRAVLDAEFAPCGCPEPDCQHHRGLATRQTWRERAEQAEADAHKFKAREDALAEQCRIEMDARIQAESDLRAKLQAVRESIMTATCRWCRHPAPQRCHMCGLPVCPRHAIVTPLKRRGRLAEDQKRVRGYWVMCRSDCE